VKVLLVSMDPQVRTLMGVAVSGLARAVGEPVELLEAKTGLGAARAAWREEPDVVVADEITSKMGAFALARELKGAAEPFSGAVVIILERRQDEWLAAWSGADAWFVKPVNPFELAETVKRLVVLRPKETVT